MKKQTKPTKPLARHHKIIAVGVAVLAAVGLVAGTLAWTPPGDQNSEAGMGGRETAGANMHDDFNGQYNRDIYVENYETADVYVRILLREYQESGTGATKRVIPSSASKADITTWRIHKQQEATNDFSTWWKWTQGSTAGERFFKPTDPDDADASKVQKPGAPNNYSNDYFYTKKHFEEQPNAGLRILPEAKVLSIAEWRALPAAQKKGNYWVGDTDGWYYWAAPLAGGTATGLLLNATDLIKKPGNPYYYGVNATFYGADDDDVGVMYASASSGGQEIIALIAQYEDVNSRLRAAIADADAIILDPGFDYDYTTASGAVLKAARAAAVAVNIPTATDTEKLNAIQKIKEAISGLVEIVDLTRLALKPIPSAESLGFPAEVGPTYGSARYDLYDRSSGPNADYWEDLPGRSVVLDHNIWYMSNYIGVGSDVNHPYKLLRPGSIPLVDIIADYDDFQPTTVTPLDPRFKGNNVHGAWANGGGRPLGSDIPIFSIENNWKTPFNPNMVHNWDLNPIQTSLLWSFEPTTDLGDGLRHNESFYSLNMTSSAVDSATGETYRTTVVRPTTWYDYDQLPGKTTSPFISTDVILEHQGKKAKIRVTYMVSQHPINH